MIMLYCTVAGVLGQQELLSTALVQSAKHDSAAKSAALDAMRAAEKAKSEARIDAARKAAWEAMTYEEKAAWVTLTY